MVHHRGPDCPLLHGANMHLLARDNTRNGRPTNNGAFQPIDPRAATTPSRRFVRLLRRSPGSAVARFP
jgi:hypothetical protein